MTELPALQTVLAGFGGAVVMSIRIDSACGVAEKKMLGHIDEALWRSQISCRARRDADRLPWIGTIGT